MIRGLQLRILFVLLGVVMAVSVPPPTAQGPAGSAPPLPGWRAGPVGGAVERPSSQARAAVTQVRVEENYGKLPLTFEANRGQTAPQVTFLARGAQFTFFLTPTEAVVVSTKGERRERRAPGPPLQPAQGTPTQAVLRLSFVGARAAPRSEGLEALPGKAHYFIGNDPTQWRTNVPTFAKVRYHDLYPEIDLIFYGTQRQLEYDFVVHPGGDPTRITLGVQGAGRVEVDTRGDLVLHTAVGPIRQRKPGVYQEGNGVRREIAGGYVLKGARQVGFQVAAYDPTRPLIIDPVLAYSTYLGGSGFDSPNGIAVDAAGNAYVTGGTNSPNFPTTPGAFQTTFLGPGDASGSAVFVTKLNPTGTKLLYSTYLGGSRSGDTGSGIAVDALGSAYVTGLTRSTNFPTTPGAFQTSKPGGGEDGFVAKLNPTGSALVYSTYLGGSGPDGASGIAVDAAGNAYVTGATKSTDFPTTPGAFQTSLLGFINAFVTKLNPTGSGLVYSTYLSGIGGNIGNLKGQGIAVDGAGNAYVTGSDATIDIDFGIISVFVAKFDPTGSGPTASPKVGVYYVTFPIVTRDGQSSEGEGIAVDAAGNAYVTGVGVCFGGDFTSAFVLGKLNSAGAPAYGFCLGGSRNAEGRGIAVDTLGNAYVTGFTTSPNFPTVNPVQASLNGAGDAFVTKVNPLGTLVYSTFLGGSGGDEGHGIAVDTLGNAYVTGLTGSPDFPTTSGAFQRTFGGFTAIGSTDAFVAKITATPAEELAALEKVIAGFGLQPGDANSLLAKVRAAEAALARGNTNAACNELQALVNEAQAQSGKSLTPGQAMAIITAAQAIRSGLGCA